MKYFLALMMALAVSFSSATFAAADPADRPFTNQDCIQMGEMAYMIATARDQGVAEDAILTAIVGSNGEATSEELEAFTAFVSGVFNEPLTPDVIGVAVIQSCIAEITNG